MNNLLSYCELVDTKIREVRKKGGFKGPWAFMQHFKFEKWRIRFLMSRTGQLI